MLNRILLQSLKCCRNSSPFSYTFWTSDEGCVVFVTPSFNFLLKALPLRENGVYLSSTVLEAALHALYSCHCGRGSAFYLFDQGEKLLSRYNIQHQLLCLGRGRNILDDSNELFLSLSKVTVYTGTGVHFSGKSRRNGFLISFVLTTEAEGSRSSCSVSDAY